MGRYSDSLSGYRATKLSRDTQLINEQARTIKTQADYIKQLEAKIEMTNNGFITCISCGHPFKAQYHTKKNNPTVHTNCPKCNRQHNL